MNWLKTGKPYFLNVPTGAFISSFRSSCTLSIKFISAFALLSSLFSSVNAMEIVTDIQYAKAGERELLLDLFLPDNIDSPNLVVWAHGGAWSFGTKEDIHIINLANEGFAVASIDFRNSPEAPFPAQIHDIKAAIRYLRANAAKYGFDSENIAISGYSSGGHLAALVGTSNGNKILEGELGEHLATSSNVQAIIDYSGPSNLQTILHQSTAHGVSVRTPAIEKLLGKAVDDPAIKDIVVLASPVFQVSVNDPPIFILHGVQDNQVPINQAIELADAYTKMGLKIQTQWVVEAEHTSGEYFEAPYIKQVANFLRSVL